MTKILQTLLAKKLRPVEFGLAAVRLLIGNTIWEVLATASFKIPPKEFFGAMKLILFRSYGIEPAYGRCSASYGLPTKLT